MTDEEAIDYIECARELSRLSSVLLRQATDPTKKMKEKIEGSVGDFLYWLWLLSTEYLSEEKIRKQIQKYEEKKIV